MTTALMPPRDVARVYGVPLRAVRQACRSGELAYVRLGAKYLLSTGDVEVWLAAHRQPRAPRVPVAIVPAAIPAGRHGRRSIDHLLPPRGERMFTS